MASRQVLNEGGIGDTLENEDDFSSNNTNCDKEIVLLKTIWEVKLKRRWWTTQLYKSEKHSRRRSWELLTLFQPRVILN